MDRTCVKSFKCNKIQASTTTEQEEEGEVARSAVG